MGKNLVTAALVATALVLGGSIASAEDPCQQPVSTSEGPVIGARDGGACAYKGIPYARPPVGDLRWRAPKPPAVRTQPLPALQFSPECSQVEMFPAYLRIGRHPVRSEDCLYLNIWRPPENGVYPVMVWIHGGSLTSGSGSSSGYEGDLLAAEKDMVLVTFNYRLGALGFLAHPGLAAEDPHHSSGNYGMLDQVQTLKWVRRNIAKFGGDPDNVTIFGESAGGWSVCMHLASPLSTGLFQRAIMQSGGCDMTRTMEQGFSNGEDFAARLGCSGAERIACMRSKSVEQVVGAMPSRKDATGDYFDLNAWEHIWAPHQDGWFLTESPLLSLRIGNYNKVPFIVGSNHDEGKLFAAEYKVSYRRTGKARVVEALTRSLGPERLSVFTKIYPFADYDRPIDAFVDAKGDISLGCKGFEAAEAATAFPSTYYYRFDYAQNLAPHILGAAHGFEIPFIFDSLDHSPYNLLYSKSRRQKARPLVQQMMSYWTNFARSGDPNGPGLIKWPVYEQKQKSRLILDLPAHIETTENVENCEFWKTGAPETRP